MKSFIATLGFYRTVDTLNFSIMTDEKEKLSSGKAWLQAECDFMIWDKNWFFS